MEDNREHPNPHGLEELLSVGLGPGRLVEAGDLFKMQIEKAMGFKVGTNIKDNRLSAWLDACSGERVAHFALSLFPGNYDIVVSTGSWVAENRRGVGIGWQLLKMRLAVVKKVGFQLMLATVENANAKEVRLLTENKFIMASPMYMSTSTARFFYRML